MDKPFYDEGTDRGGLLRWPAVAARRLLRRVQRPFFLALRAALDRLSAESAAHRAELDRQRAELERYRAELNDHFAELHAHRVDLDRDRADLNRIADALARQSADVERAREALEVFRRRLGTQVENEGLHPLGVLAALEALDRASRPAAPPADGPPPRVLFAVSSASQLYSGIGRAIFETVRRLAGRVSYEFAIDDAAGRNVDLLAAFCAEHRLPLHVGRAVKLPDCVDWGNEALPGLLTAGGWDAVECVSWASSATNAAVLEHAGPAPIVYTPHSQPTWTVPAPAEVHRRIAEVHGGLLRRAALVACDSPWEWLMLRAEAGPGVDCVLLPLGIDPAGFPPGGEDRKPQLLFVGDQREGRKRFPLILRVFAELLARLPEYRLVVAGNQSEEIGRDVPEAVRGRCDLRGYVSEEELRALYRESMGLVLLSDYEAFGLPAVEALASGTPVFLSRRGPVSSVFARYRGAVLIDDDVPAAMAEPIAAALARGPELIRDALADRPRVAAELSWDVLTERRFEAVRAALARHRAGRAAA